MNREQELSRARRRALRTTGAGMTSLGLYRPGDGPMHRLPAVAKVVALAVLSVAVVVARGPFASLGLFLVALVALSLTQPPLRTTLHALAPLTILALLSSAYQLWRGNPASAVEIGADLLTLVLAATALTVSTRMEDLLTVLVRSARPLRRWVPPEALALSVALMLRTIPALSMVLAETRDAARARGLSRDPRALLIPAAIRTVARAQATGAALAARGIGEEEPQEA